MDTNVLSLRRDGLPFQVVDDPATRTLNFWLGQFADGTWEPETLAAIRRIGEAADGRVTMLDVGAWVGPTALWGSYFFDHVVAVEPDPVAAEVLRHNAQLTFALDSPPSKPITVCQQAIGAERGTATLRPASIWTVPTFGNSESTLRGHGVGDGVEVETVPLTDLVHSWDGAPFGLVKIDVEGYEQHILEGDGVDVLHDLTCPILLDLHLQWVPDAERTMTLVHQLGKVTVIDDVTRPDFPTILVTP